MFEVTPLKSTMPPAGIVSAELPAVAALMKFKRPATLNVGANEERLRMPAPLSVSVYGLPISKRYAGAPALNWSAPSVEVRSKLIVVIFAVPNCATSVAAEGTRLFVQLVESLQFAEVL